ncbi:efflux RND transporter permease subunit [Sulfoacidibacillus thermotolerans]|uniref:Acriflavin resistance protein n=1 Tax=Sulfoacidibacillus thermotolerans TaxID=1765684 RepID=A0A2U3D7Q0_SULT2|nr:efflux RND transporter permease subunit [Sulfoacidibacillus thermotolerans]PWI57307.1 acriflavin resistance protein [Sulfoacidibacillus thermotolerans]
MKIADFSIRRSVTITMIMAAVLLIGTFSIFQLPIELEPALDIPVASVATSWPGASPAEVEQQVTQPIENALQSLPGVSEIDSTSSLGNSQVVVQFNYGVNIYQEVDDMRSIVNRVQSKLPSDATTPIVQQFNPTNKPIITIALSGNEPLSAITDLATNVVEPAFEHLNGVGSVNVIGGLTRQINVLVNPSRLMLYHLSIGQVVSAISAGNLTVDAGQVNKGDQLIPLRVKGQITAPQQIAQIPITSGQETLSVGDVATIQDGYANVSFISTLNGQPAVSFTITQATNANTVQVSQETKQALRQLQKQLPPSVKLTLISDSANTIQGTIDTVVEHTILGFLIGMLVMLFILRSVRTTLIIGVAIPIAMISTFILMNAAGLTINSATLGSLAVGLGSLVDFSIVVLESIFRARQRGLSPVEAAKQGTAEVGLAVVVAAMAQISVFAPSIFVPGVAGQFFGPIAMTVSFSHLAALFVAITFTPMLASKFLKGRRFELEETIPGKTAPFRPLSPFDWSGRAMHDLTQGYRKLLTWSLRHRGTVIGGAVLMVIVSFALVPLIGFELIPTVNTNQISITTTLANGTNLATTTKFTQRLEQLAQAHMPDVKSMFAQIGSTASDSFGATNASTITVTLGAKARNLDAIAHQFHQYVAAIPGAQIVVEPVSAASNGPASAGVQVDVQGPDLQTLAILSNEVAQIMERTKGLEYVDNTLSTGMPDDQLNINQAALQQYGLTEQQVESTLHDAFQGVNASTYFVGDNQYNINVQLPESFSRNISNLSQIFIMNNAGDMIPLEQIATLTTSQEPPVIDHTNGVRSVTIKASVYGISAGRAQNQIAAQIRHLRIPAGYSINFGQEGKFIAQAFADLGIAVIFSIVLLYMVMASLFESFITPFVIMFSLPPTFIGGALGLFLTHRSLNIDSFIGVIMVMGLIANNAIVLVDYTNQLRARGLSLTKALEEAGPIRLRPILMSTLTTVLAMLPLVLGFGTGGATLASMATVIAFGLLFSTLVTLILVPVVYVTTDNNLTRIKRLFHRTSPMDPTIPQGM